MDDCGGCASTRRRERRRQIRRGRRSRRGGTVFDAAANSRVLLRASPLGVGESLRDAAGLGRVAEGSRDGARGRGSNRRGRARLRRRGSSGRRGAPSRRADAPAGTNRGHVRREGRRGVVRGCARRSFARIVGGESARAREAPRRAFGRARVRSARMRRRAGPGVSARVVVGVRAGVRRARGDGAHERAEHQNLLLSLRRLRLGRGERLVLGGLGVVAVEANLAVRGEVAGRAEALPEVRRHARGRERGEDLLGDVHRGVHRARRRVHARRRPSSRGAMPPAGRPRTSLLPTRVGTGTTRDSRPFNGRQNASSSSPTTSDEDGRTPRARDERRRRDGALSARVGRHDRIDLARRGGARVLAVPPLPRVVIANSRLARAPTDAFLPTRTHAADGRPGRARERPRPPHAAHSPRGEPRRRRRGPLRPSPAPRASTDTGHPTLHRDRPRPDRAALVHARVRQTRAPRRRDDRRRRRALPRRGGRARVARRSRRGRPDGRAGERHEFRRAPTRTRTRFRRRRPRARREPRASRDVRGRSARRRFIFRVRRFDFRARRVRARRVSRARDVRRDLDARGGRDAAPAGNRTAVRREKPQRVARFSRKRAVRHEERVVRGDVRSLGRRARRDGRRAQRRVSPNPEFGARPRRRRPVEIPD